MLTRRLLLGYSAAGMLAGTAGCRPANFNWSLNQDELSSNANLSLSEKAKLARQKHLLLGYPINMNTPPEEFFAWRRQLRKAGIGDFAYNNVGNPYEYSPIPYNTHDFEREMILRFGGLFGFRPSDILGISEWY